MLYRTLLFIAATASLIACNSEPKKDGNIAVHGTAPVDFAGQQIYLFTVDAQSQQKADSALINEDGSFELISTIEKLDFYQIGIDSRNRINLGLQPNEEITLTIRNAQFEQDYNISGSTESEKIQEVIGLQIEGFQKQDSLGKAIQAAQQQQDVMSFTQLRQMAQESALNYQAKLAKFATSNSSSIASLIALQQLNVDQNFEVYEKVITDLKPSMEGHFFYDNFASVVASKKKLAVGAIAPDLKFPNPTGELIAVSDYRGKYVLLDFWASWCKPCRMENPNVVRMYEKYSSKGFEIVGISLDQKEQAWVSAINQDKLTWPQMSDLKGWSAEPAQVYGVRAIPATFLLDPEGKIIAKDLRGHALEEKLQELFGA
jgi:peroxiredoxin